jgi:hypothetical protein
MGLKSKVILGLREKRYPFSKHEKIKIIEDYLSSGLSKRVIWEKYTGQSSEHGHILRWMRRFGYEEADSFQITTFADSQKVNPMKKKTVSGAEEFELLQLRKRVSELEKQVSESEMKAAAFSTMVDIAEREFGIVIRKKFNTSATLSNRTKP